MSWVWRLKGQVAPRQIVATRVQTGAVTLRKRMRAPVLVSCPTIRTTGNGLSGRGSEDFVDRLSGADIHPHAADDPRALERRHPEGHGVQPGLERVERFPTERVVERPVAVEVPLLVEYDAVGIARVRHEANGLARDRGAREKAEAGVRRLVGGYRRGGRQESENTANGRHASVQARVHIISLATDRDLEIEL